MNAAKLVKLANGCEQQSMLLWADWEFQSRAGSGKRLAGAPALPGIRDERAAGLMEIDPALAAVVENPLLFARPVTAAVKLARWAEL